jgi:SAM-dependent methyltransferase
MTNETREIKFETLSSLESYRIIGRETVNNLRDLARYRRRRSADTVSADYDQRNWKEVVEKKPWLKCAELEEYLVPTNQEARVAMIHRRLVRIATNQYYQFRLRTLQEVIAHYAQDASQLVELGCGTGLNLFSLFLSERWERLEGFDISTNAIQAAREAAQHFHLSNIDFGILDLTDPNDSNLKRLSGKTAFTYYCLEQLKYSTPIVIDNLVKAGIRRVIHIEPATELLRLWSPSDLLSYLYITKMDYQDNLLRTLERVERRGAIRIVDKKRLGYAPTCKNDPMLVCWETV